MNALVIIEAADLTPAIFSDHDAIDKIVSDIEAKVRATPTDISTAKGRKEVASLAFKVARSKTALDEMGKSLVSGLKAQSKLIDTERAKVWDRLEALQAEVRKPLDEYEAVEADRIAGHEKTLAWLAESRVFATSPTVAMIRAQMVDVQSASERDWQEFSARAKAATADAVNGLKAMLATAEQAERDAAELQRRRIEQAAQERQEREDRIAAEAAAKATREAESKAAREAQEAADRAAEALRKADQEQREATARALKAERDFAVAAAKAEQDKKDAAAKAGRDRLAAIEAERRRVADAKAAEAAEIARREADKAHRKTINSEALAALVAAGLTIEQGVIAITAIVKCAVPHIRISY